MQNNYHNTADDTILKHKFLQFANPGILATTSPKIVFVSIFTATLMSLSRVFAGTSTL